MGAAVCRRAGPIAAAGASGLRGRRLRPRPASRRGAGQDHSRGRYPGGRQGRDPAGDGGGEGYQAAPPGDLRAVRYRPPRPGSSRPRIRDEFSKLLVSEQVQRGLELLDATRLLPRIVPQLEAGKGMQQGGWHSHDVFGHSLLTASLAPPELITRLAALLHDVGKPAVHELKDGKPTFIGHQEIGAAMASAALRHLRYPGELTDDVVKLVRLHMRPIQYDPQGWEDKAVRRLVRDAGDQLEPLLALARADMRASHYPDVKKIDDLEARIRRLDAQAIAAIRSPLTGEDLMVRTGRPAGPWIKRAKAALEDAIVDGTLDPDAQAAWRYLEAHPELLQP